jgi:phage recombination protein Bet
MSNAVVPIDKNDWSPEQVALIKKTVFPDSTDDELKVFIYVAKKTALDPFSRQIYAVKRKNNQTGEMRMTVQTSIDGFRLIAFRTNAYAGRDEAIFEYDSKNLPIKCKVTVYKLVQGIRCAFTATARWDEYYPGDRQGFMWNKLPETMLEKCTESKALRMAFPAELSNLYTGEEMEQADSQKGRVVSQQPDDADGVTPDGYIIDFGQWRMRTLEDVYKNFGPEKMADYIDYLQNEAKKKSRPLNDKAAKYIKEAEAFLGAMENGGTSNE